jgi:hypothetical protein
MVFGEVRACIIVPSGPENERYEGGLLERLGLIALFGLEELLESVGFEEVVFAERDWAL